MILTEQTFLIFTITIAFFSIGALLMLYGGTEKQTNDLEQLVKQRTQEIKRLQEDQRQIMLDISHGLQSPLAIILGELELLHGVNKKKIQAIKKSIQRVSEFIRELLHLARLDNSIYTIELSALNLTDLLKDQTQYVEVITQHKNIHITLSSEENIFIRGHRKLIEELFINLISNAILYRNKDKKRSVINIILSKTNTNAIVTIEDNGIGIAKDELSSLFTRFYRSKSVSDTQRGTGLGLAICKKIVERHNGTITVESVLGQKTTFKITIPLIDEIHPPRSF